MLGLELQAMRAVGDPRALTLDILPRRDRGCRPDHGHEVPVATDFDAQDAETRFFTVERDTLDRTREVFERMGIGWCLCRRFHGIDHSMSGMFVHTRTPKKGEAMALTMAREDGEGRSWREGYYTPGQ